MPGSIAGTVTRLGSVQSVKATNARGETVYTGIPHATGIFILSDLGSDTYYLTAIPVTGSGLYAPFRKTIAIGNGQAFNMGIIGLTNTEPPHPVTCLVFK